MSLEILQIVPRLPPSISGVGDYAYLLARELRDAHGIQTRFIVCDPSRVRKNDLDGFRVERINAPKSEELARQLTSSEGLAAVLLHYVGYGYEKRGCPFWLVRALERWRSAATNRRLAVMFHEVAAERGPFPSSSFFSSPLQRLLAQRLARIADKCLTNMRRSARLLEGLAPKHGGRVVVRPVFSNVGEPDKIPAWPERNPWMAIFGGEGWIERAFGEHRTMLLQSCRDLNLERIVVVGEWHSKLPPISIAVDCHGALSNEETSRVLLNCRAGWLSYPAAFLAKSGVFAAYCAHSIVPILPKAGVNEDDVVTGRHLLVHDVLPPVLNDEVVRSVSAEARSWYAGHTLMKTAGSFASLLGLMVSVPIGACIKVSK